MPTAKSAAISALIVLVWATASCAAGFWGALELGSYAPGFKMIAAVDSSRTFLSHDGNAAEPRPVRIYLWYPAEKSPGEALDLARYVRLATEEGGLPVPLEKGLPPEDLKKIEVERTAAVEGAPPAAGKFPLLVMGQGLYYESPLSHFVLCEFLASHGYVVATSPLVGTLYRLTNITTEDLETEMRDMEFVLAKAKESTFVDAEKIGVIGYDLGGIAGLTLCMRRPDVRAYLSFDAAVLAPHRSGLPNSHPSYREDRFVVPWMHLTQARFIESLRRQSGSLLFDRKSYGDTYLVHVPTKNHGQFSSYAMLGITTAVPGYWDSVEGDTRKLYEAMCRLSLDFLDAYLLRDDSALARLHAAGRSVGSTDEGVKVEFKEGQPPPPSEAEIVNLIIEKGMREARPIVEAARQVYPDSVLCNEQVLNWLGYHFLRWWGREKEAVEVFELNASLHPASANVYDSLGEAYMAVGDTAKGIASYRKALELNPENRAAAEIIRKYEEGQKK